MADFGYHPLTAPTLLPSIEIVKDLDKLPWGGNHWWDWPIMLHVYRQVVCNEDKPRELRKAVMERAGYLMTGEDCSLNETEFDEQVEIARASLHDDEI